jgi:hypothetical protein
LKWKGIADGQMALVLMTTKLRVLLSLATLAAEVTSGSSSSKSLSLVSHYALVDRTDKPDAVDGVNKLPGSHPMKSMIIGGDGAWIPFPAHSLLVYLGPKVQMLALDCRAERKLHQICSKEHYERAFGEVRKVPSTTEQLVVLLGVPIGESWFRNLTETSVSSHVIRRALP